MSRLTTTLAVLCLLALYGCTTQPPAPRISEQAPALLMRAPRPLQPLPDGEVQLSTVAATVAGNYGACHANAAQLEQLQAYVREREKVFSAAPAP